MRRLLPYAWRSLVARPARSVFTVAGIGLGVAVLSAALAVDAGLDAGVERTVQSLVGRADLRVAAFTETGLGPETLAALDDVPGVALTAPTIERRAFLVSAAVEGDTGPVTILGIDPAREPRVRDIALVRGAALDAPDEPVALVTEVLAATERLDVGSRVTILGAGVPLDARVVGIVAGAGPSVGSSGRTVYLPILTAAALAQPDAATAVADVEPRPSGVTRVDIVVTAGTDVTAVEHDIELALAREPYVLSRPVDMAASLGASTADIRATMALLAAITLFAAAFLILNTLAMTVVERVRELGLLRAAGATRGQVVRVVLAQALVLGAAGSLAGLVAGLGLAWVAAAWLASSRAIDVATPLLTPPIAATALLAGLVVTLVAALEPARRAAGVTPATALRARGDPSATVRAHVAWLAVVIVAVGAVSIVALPELSGVTGGARAVWTYAVLLAAVLVTPLLLAPLARVAGLPFRPLLRLEERLARAAIGRDPARTALTVGTLVVGLAMVVALGSVAVNARGAATAWLGDVVPGDEILTSIAPASVGEGGMDAELASVPGVALAAPLATFDLAYRGTRLEAVAVNGRDLAADGRLTFTAGDRGVALGSLDTGGAAILSRDRAARLALGLGDALAVATAGGTVELRVVGIVERSFPGRGGDAVLVGWRDALERFGVAGADAFAVRYAAVGSDKGAAAARATVRAFATERALSVAPISRIEGSVADALDGIFGLLDVLALAAVVVAALGIANTLSMGTWERVRELGTLRAVGMSSRQVWRSVLVEAGVLGIIGGIVGSLAGVVVGGLLLPALASAPLPVGQVPWGMIVVACAMGVVLAMIAAAQPARLAGRRSIVAAIRGD